VSIRLKFINVVEKVIDTNYPKNAL
jgi:hypothetical protein